MFQKCLPVFWGKNICDNVRLLLTDGCTEEYLPFILNIGFDSTFPKAVHGLCYYHLAIQGFKTHVYPNIPKTGRFSKSSATVIPVIKRWVKEWFFVVEDKEEYEHSRMKFNEWVKSLQNKKLSSVTVEAIFVWITTSLEPLNCLWVNYHRLLKFGLNGRTTSIGEALHWATKGSFDRVLSSMTPATSANTQMTQAERKGNNLRRLNAQNLQFSNTWSESNTHEHLTDWAERWSQDEWDLSQERKCIQINENEYLVYKPHDLESEIKCKCQ